MDPSLDSTITVTATVQKAGSPRSDLVSSTLPEKDGLLDPDLPTVAARLDKFSILRVLGSGAMGVVYAAYDEQLGRKVAIKLVRQHLVRHTSRFVREAQGLARLSHPNVVQIYEIGDYKDRLFIAMEFVAGRTLNEWMKDAHSQAEILQTFIDAGRGLAAAHAANLVHRDFKPDNVMVGDDGRVRVMDFGLVHEDDDGKGPDLSEESEHDDLIVAERRLESALNLELTQPGSLVGTPAYMAPEQHLGDPTDARSDQFSFCVALWEALYGRRPFSGKSWKELLENVTAHRIDEPPRGADVPGWLRAVVERGLAVDPKARWDSMDTLLTALGTDPTKRRRWIVAATFGLALTATAWAGNEVRLENQREAAAIAEAAEREASRARCEAEGDAIHEVWNQGVRDQIGAAFLATEHRLAEGSWSSTRETLDEYTESWDAMRTQVCVDVDVEGQRDAEWAGLARACLDERASALESLASVLTQIDHDSVIIAVNEAARLPSLRDCTGAHPTGPGLTLPLDPVARTRVQEALGVRAEIEALAGLGKNKEAKEAAHRLLAEAETIDWPPLEAAAHYWIGRIEMEFGALEIAETHLEDSLFVAGELKDNTALQAASALVYLSGYKRGDHTAALRWGRLGQLLVKHADASGDLAEAKLLTELGTVHAGRKAFTDATASYLSALEIYEARLVPDHPDIALVLTTLGAVHFEMGEIDAAQRELERAREIYRTSLPPDHPQPAYNHTNIGWVYERQGKLDQALDSYAAALRLFEMHWGEDYPMLAYPLTGMGRVLEAQGSMAMARARLERALALRETTPGTSPTDLAETRFVLARVLWRQGQREAADALAAKAQATYKDLGELEELAEVESWLAERTL